MNALKRAQRVLRSGVSDDLGPVIKKLPATLRRMGLVRTLESLDVGKHAVGGNKLFQRLAVDLDLPPRIPDAVEKLETCSRVELFRVHQRALELVDALALVYRIQSTGGRA